MWILNILIIALFIVLAIEDFVHKAISWKWVILLFCFALILNICKKNPDFFINTMLNLLFILIQLIIITLVFSLKQGYLVNIFKRHFGLGDALVLATLCLFFHPIIFVFFYLSISIYTIIIYSFLQWINNVKILIPFVSMLSIGYILFFVLSIVISNIDLFHNIDWINELLPFIV